MNISVHADADLTAVAHSDLANAVRFLAVDAIETSQSGHPGLPMGMADVATVLFSRFLKFDSAHPNWPDRDRFVLSAGPRLDAALCTAPSHRRRRQPRRHQGASGNGARRRRAIRNMATRRASRRRPARWGRGSRPPSAWRSPSAWPMRGMATASSTTSPM